MKLLKQKLKPNNFVKIVFPVILILLLIFGFSAAQTNVDELKGNIVQKQTELERINAEISNLQKEINRRQSQAASLKNELALFDLQIQQTESQIQATQIEIDQLATQILETQIEIKNKQQQMDDQKKFLAETLRLIYEYDNVTALELTLGNDTFSQFLDQIQYTTNLQEKNQELLDEIKTLKTELENKKAELDQKLIDKEQLQQKLVATKDSLGSQRDQKQNILTKTRGQEKIYQTLLSEASKKQEEVEREIFETEIAIRQRLGDKTLPPIGGLLRWPMSGILTQGYGNTGFTALGYSFHNGIDIAAPAGTNVYAAGDGLVYATGRGQAAYGNWVVIKHTLDTDGKLVNIFTLYGHLQAFIVSSGKPVKGGDLIGFEGNTGNTTRLLYGPERGYHVHFMVFDEDGFDIKDGAYQDLYGPYQIPYGYTYNPLNFLR